MKTVIPESKKLKMLIVEDNYTSSMLIKIIIKPFCNEIFSVITAENGIDILKNCPSIKVIFMDIKLPGMNGYDAIRKIREFNKKVIIIAQTAQHNEKEKAYAAGANFYISKPIISENVKMILNKYILK